MIQWFSLFLGSSMRWERYWMPELLEALQRKERRRSKSEKV
jgi:hypothetical protein